MIYFHFGGCSLAFSSCSEQGEVPSRCSGRASHRSVCSCRGVQAAGTRTSVVVALGPVALQHVGSSWPGVESAPPVLADAFLSLVPPGESSANFDKKEILKGKKNAVTVIRYYFCISFLCLVVYPAV